MRSIQDDLAVNTGFHSRDLIFFSFQQYFWLSILDSTWELQVEDAMAELRQLRSTSDIGLRERDRQLQQLKRQLTSLQAGPLGRSVPVFSPQELPTGTGTGLHHCASTFLQSV